MNLFGPSISYTRRRRIQREIPIQHAIVDFLRLHKVFCWVTNQPLLKPGSGRFKMYHWSSSGVPDILGSWPEPFEGNIYERPFCIEVKYGRGKPTEKQEEFLAEAKRRGWIAFVARSIEDVCRELNRPEWLK